MARGLNVGYTGGVNFISQSQGADADSKQNRFRLASVPGRGAVYLISSTGAGGKITRRSIACEWPDVAAWHKAEHFNLFAQLKLGLVLDVCVARTHGGRLGRGGHGVNKRVGGAPAHLRRERR